MAKYMDWILGTPSLARAFDRQIYQHMHPALFSFILAFVRAPWGRNFRIINSSKPPRLTHTDSRMGLYESSGRHYSYICRASSCLHRPIPSKSTSLEKQSQSSQELAN